MGRALDLGELGHSIQEITWRIAMARSTLAGT